MSDWALYWCLTTEAKFTSGLWVVYYVRLFGFEDTDACSHAAMHPCSPVVLNEWYSLWYFTLDQVSGKALRLLHTHFDSSIPLLYYIEVSMINMH